MSIYEIIIGDIHTLYVEEITLHTTKEVECRSWGCDYPAEQVVYSDECLQTVAFCKFCTGHILMYTVGNPVTDYPYSTTFTRVVKRIDDEILARMVTSVNEESVQKIHDLSEIETMNNETWLVTTIYPQKTSSNSANSRRHN